MSVEMARAKGYIPGAQLAAAIGGDVSSSGFWCLWGQQHGVEYADTPGGHFIAPESFDLLVQAPVLLTGWYNDNGARGPVGWDIDHGDIGICFTPFGQAANDYAQLRNPPPRERGSWALRKAYWQFHLEQVRNVYGFRDKEKAAAGLASPPETSTLIGPETDDSRVIYVVLAPYEPESPKNDFFWQQLLQNPWLVTVIGGLVVALAALVLARC